jgi:primosomal protein N' (replication factor Y)
MYAQVVVLTYQSPEIDSYTYLVPKELEKEIKIGQLVEIPFGKRNPQGIVVEIHDKKPQVPTKPVSKIVITNPLLLPYQLNLLKWMSAYYLAPMVNCLEVMQPKIPKRATSQPKDPKARSLSSPRPGLLQQTLILVPYINKIAETLAKFPKAKNYVVYHNELKTSEKFVAWQKITSGETDFIFGSRSAIFAPCPNLKEIIIYDEHDGAYKDERSPYLDTLTVAQKISEFTGAQVKIVDPSPKITTYFQLPKNIKIQSFPQKTKVVSMTNQRQGGNNSPISEEVFSYLEQTKNALLFLNKKKESGHLFCKSCKNSQYLETQPTICPACQSPDILWNVLNIQALATDVKKTLPRFAINIVSNKNKLTSSSSSNQPSVDIATAQIFYTPLVKKYDLIAHIQTDSLISHMDFTSSQNLYSQIIMLKKLLTAGGRLFLQTYNQENPAINFAANGDFESFYKDELTQRKLLSYPPYSLLVKLTIKGKNHDKIKNDAESLANQLLTTNYQLPTTVLGPYESIFWQKIPGYHIILKIKLESYNLESRKNAIAKIKGLVETLPRVWQVEVEPDSIQ